MAPDTAAFAPGLVEENAISNRVARNGSFTHAGNLVFAAVAGIAGTFIALASIFQGAAAFALGIAGAGWFIGGISEEAARRGGGNQERIRFLDPMRDKRVLAFAAVVVLFNISNAATLPLASQILTKGNNSRSSAWQIALAVAAAEIVMVVTAGFFRQTGREPRPQAAADRRLRVSRAAQRADCLQS